MSGTDPFAFLMSNGWTREQSAGILGNLFHESAGFNPGAIGDNGQAYGLAQWHRDRQAIFARVFGKPIQGSSRAEQLAFVQYELTHNESKAGAALRQTTNVADATRVFASMYERPANMSSLGARTGAANAALATGKSLLGKGWDALQNGARGYAHSIPGGDALFGITDGLGLTGECGWICQLQNWIKDSGFFQRLALAVLAFIVLFAAFYLMKGNSSSQTIIPGKWYKHGVPGSS